MFNSSPHWVKSSASRAVSDETIEINKTIETVELIFIALFDSDVLSTFDGDKLAKW